VPIALGVVAARDGLPVSPGCEHLASRPVRRPVWTKVGLVDLTHVDARSRLAKQAYQAFPPAPPGRPKQA
jgi:hypothetical protein